MSLLDEVRGAIAPLDAGAMAAARERQDRQTKPRGALGALEPLSVQLAGLAGGAPAALGEIIARGTEPALVIGMPAGFVGAAEAKQALRASGLPSLTNVSEKGGAEVAAAAADALLRSAAGQEGPGEPAR